MPVCTLKASSWALVSIVEQDKRDFIVQCILCIAYCIQCNAVRRNLLREDCVCSVNCTMCLVCALLLEQDQGLLIPGAGLDFLQSPGPNLFPTSTPAAEKARVQGQKASTLNSYGSHWSQIRWCMHVGHPLILSMYIYIYIYIYGK